MIKPANDILDTCKNNQAKFSGVSVSKLIKKNCLVLLANVVATFALILLCTYSANAAKPTYGLTKVVIDAGHGGHDPGCLGKSSKEKDIALGISLKLGKYIEDNYPDVKVIYTRKTDVFVELYERAEIANNAKADLFICIHCNSACVFNRAKKKETCNSEIAGVESWVMGLNKSDENLAVAKRENEVILLEKDYTRQYGGFDPNSPEANIIFSLYQNTFLDQSLRMASLVQQEMKSLGRQGRGVKQAGFLVLYKTTMPSILIETGFLSNAEEEKFLLSSKGQDHMASSIFNAFKSYKNAIESQKGDSGNSQNNDTQETKTEVRQEPKKEVEDKSTAPAIPVKVTEDSIKKETTKPVKKDTTKAIATKPVVAPAPKMNSDDVLQWSVQFYTSPKPISDNSKIYDAFDDVKEEFDNGMYKYSTGLFPEKNDAIKLQAKIRELGYKDAFVVAFFNNKRISMKEALEKSGRQ